MTPEWEWSLMWDEPKWAAMRRLANHAVTCLAPDICCECTERRLCVRGVTAQRSSLDEPGTALALVAWERLDPHLDHYRMSQEAEEIRQLDAAMWRLVDPIREQLADMAVEEARRGKPDSSSSRPWKTPTP